MLVARSFRFGNVAWLIVSPLIVASGSTASAFSDAVAGVAVVALSIPRVPVRARYSTAGWFRVRGPLPSEVGTLGHLYDGV